MKVKDSCLRNADCLETGMICDYEGKCRRPERYEGCPPGTICLDGLFCEEKRERCLHPDDLIHFPKCFLDWMCHRSKYSDGCMNCLDRQKEGSYCKWSLMCTEGTDCRFWGCRERCASSSQCSGALNFCVPDFSTFRHCYTLGSPLPVFLNLS